MTLELPELDHLQLAPVLDDDQIDLVVGYEGMYDPEGAVVVLDVNEVTDGRYRTAWQRVEAWRAAPENHREDRFRRRGENFIVTTRYFGLDMASEGRSSKPHHPRTWVTQVLQPGAPSVRVWHYGSRAAAFAGHDAVVATLTALPDVIEVSRRQRREARLWASDMILSFGHPLTCSGGNPDLTSHHDHEVLLEWTDEDDLRCPECGRVQSLAAFDPPDADR